VKKHSIGKIIIATVALFFAFKLGQSFQGFSHLNLLPSFHIGSLFAPIIVFVQWLIFLLLPIVLIIAGYILWRSAKKNSLKKWIGITFFTIGLMMVLPKIILIPIILLAIYFACKNKNHKETSFSYDFHRQPRSTNADFLDQWENKLK
jgi:hypothetical protein